MARLIGQVLDASRLQSGVGLRMQPESLDLSALLAEVLNEARLAYPDSLILQELESPLIAEADAGRIVQLCGELISNAREYGAANGPTVVQLSRQGAEFFIEVSNIAPPIDAGFLPNLFAAVHRTPAPKARKKSGLGLGLHIAQAIARGHRGYIRYRYAEPYVVFTVRFPAGLGAAVGGSAAKTRTQMPVRSLVHAR